MRRLSFIYLVLILISCDTSKKADSFQYVKEFYHRAKEKEQEIKVFYNVSAEARGINPVDSTYRILRIEIRVNDSVNLTIPEIKKYMNSDQIKELPFYENISEFKKLNNLSAIQAQDSVKKLSYKITSLMNELRTYKVLGGNLQGIGEFIIFGVTSDYDMIYVQDTSKISHKYWKAFFSSENKFDDHWYYRKTHTR
jgi:hypothetical protein